MSATKKIQYSAEVPNSPEIPGEGKPRRSIDCLDKPLMTTYDPLVNSLHDNFNNGVKISGKLRHQIRKITTTIS